MLLNLGFALAISLFFIIVALPISRFFFKKLNADVIVISVLLGLVIEVVLASWLITFAKLNEVFWAIQILSLMFAYYFFFRKTTMKNLFDQSFISKLPMISAFISTFIFSFLSSEKLLGNKIAMRNGPDLIGWISSSRYFCNQGNLTGLETKITSDLNLTNSLDAFKNPIENLDNSIYQVASVVTQVNGEFLVGARRIGIPGVQGQLCQIVGENHLISIVSSFSLIAIFVSTYICGMIIRDYQMKNAYKLIIPVLAITNVNAISVFLEGGYGQLLATPFFLFGVYCFTREEKNFDQRGLASLLIIAFSLSTYFDLALIFGLFILVLWICNLLLTKRNLLKNVKKTDWNLIGIGLLLGVPGLLTAPRLLMDRLGSGTYGGWDQGRVPTPADFFGLINWLPSNGVNSTPRSISIKIIEVSITIVILAFLWKNRLNVQIQPALAAMIVYSMLMFLTYSNGREGSNNYTVWKASAYLSMFLILFALPRNKENQGGKKASDKKDLSKTTIPIILVLTILSSLNWTDSWLSTRQFNFNEPDKKMIAIIDKYDLAMFGFAGAGSYKFLLLGDIHYLAESRGFSVLTKRSNPPRELAFVLPNEKCLNLNCKLNQHSFYMNNKLEIIYANKEYRIYA
jgi:hypothetical protein